MEKIIINTDKAPIAVGPYVQAVQIAGTLYTSGQLGLIPITGELPDGIEAQTKQALNNIHAILKHAGYTIEDVIKTTVFLTNMDDFAVVNKIYEDFFGDVKPARSCVQIGKLPKNGMVEIELIALKER